jgi:hypothetical protein
VLLNPEAEVPDLFGDTLNWVIRLRDMKALKMIDMAKKVGLPKKEIMRKLEDRILDPIHMRSVRRYIRGIVEMSKEMASRKDTPKQPQKEPPVQQGQEDTKKRKKPEQHSIPCPLLRMGYAGVECEEMVSRHKIMEHLACHVATLTKRVNELETRLLGDNTQVLVDD